MNDFLETIVARTRERVKSLAPPRPPRAGQPFAFSRALAGNKIHVIAEIKSASPSAGSIVENPDVDSIARIFARRATAISIVTEPEFSRLARLAVARRTRGASAGADEGLSSISASSCAVAVGANAILLGAARRREDRGAIAILSDFDATRRRVTTSASSSGPSTAVRASSA
jgi:hypothetical protein